jgi:hypothetical protein
LQKKTLNYNVANRLFVSAKIFEQYGSFLIDTGADISIIYKDLIPLGIREEAFYGQIKSACGANMQISRSKEILG